MTKELNKMSNDEVVDLLLEKLRDEELAGLLGMDFEEFLELDSGEVVDNLFSKVKFSDPEEFKEWFQ